ncbi:putative casein kinase substrate, phosphoprotein PP28 [Rosa chinensis]|uniref:Putative casein kinase substrate, phosphoprotein PP28 n=1 Tax=Rosa chinensis TaxID=74649 RepID=A0A2P6Q4D6_ROSCH|nr:putative casein kinase substrate, phosphoprotein PP28 [Rosa chinensis]
MDRSEAEHEEEPEEDFVSFEDGSDEESDGQDEKKKGVQGIIEIENPNVVKPKTLKAKDIDIGKPTELSRREREELEKQRARERYMKLQEQGKTEQARKDLERLALIRLQREEAAKKREEEKNGNVPISPLPAYFVPPFLGSLSLLDFQNS